MRFIITLILVSSSTYAQSVIEWDGNYNLQLSDFQSPTTQITGANMYSLYSGSGFDFAFHMSNAEFMFTKNFNTKVNCSFKKNIASLISPDSTRAFELLDLARYDFDLAELYARKFRQRLYDSKGAFSDASFFHPIYDQIQKEFMERQIQTAQLTELGHNKEKLEGLHQEVLREINSLSDFCKTCIPPKKKKK